MRTAVVKLRHVMVFLVPGARFYLVKIVVLALARAFADAA